MKKTYLVPQVEDMQLDPLMQGITIAGISKAEIESADAPTRGEGLKYL